MYIAKGNVSYKGNDYKKGDPVPEKIALRIITCVKKVKGKEPKKESEEDKIMTSKEVKKKTTRKK